MNVETTAFYFSRSTLPYVICFLRLFCRMRNRSLVSEREFTRLVGRSVGQSVGQSLGRKLLFVFPPTNAQLHLTKNVVEWFGKCET